jgi:ABC-type transporter Mla subunit MlaD
MTNEIYEETQQSIIEIPARLEDISDQLKQTNDRLSRIADALELLASVIQPQFKDRDANNSNLEVSHAPARGPQAA